MHHELPSQHTNRMRMRRNMNRKDDGIRDHCLCMILRLEHCGIQYALTILFTYPGRITAAPIAFPHSSPLLQLSVQFVSPSSVDLVIYITLLDRHHLEG